MHVGDQDRGIVWDFNDHRCIDPLTGRTVVHPDGNGCCRGKPTEDIAVQIDVGSLVHKNDHRIAKTVQNVIVFDSQAKAERVTHPPRGSRMTTTCCGASEIGQEHIDALKSKGGGRKTILSTTKQRRIVPCVRFQHRLW
jgi:hypothetical protein